MSTDLTVALASGNAGKLREINQMLSHLPLTLKPQSDWHVASVEETGETFIENALIKARHAALTTDTPVIAEDSGLVVPALGGAPGLYSARYAGPDATDEANREHLLAQMSEITDRQAYYYCMLVYLPNAHHPIPQIFEGRWQGEITLAPVGDGGFGYDPVFYVPERKCTSAQLAPDEKNQLSHRAKALSQLTAYFNDTL